MGFENPGYLWGALAALIPLILHLIARRRARVHEFSAIEFILVSNKKIARRLKLKQWLLLALRMLLVGALPIAFAKPYATSEEVALPATGAEPVSVVLILDPSFSMGFRQDGDTLMEKAKEKALAIVADLRPESDAAVVVASTPARALTSRLTFDRRELKLAVRSVALTHARGDMLGALRLAEQILVESGGKKREVVLLTDLQASEWEGMGRPWSLDHSPHVTLLDVGSSRERGNVGITRVVASPESSGLGREVRIQVDVLNDRPQPFEDVVTVRVSGKTAKGVLRIPPRGRATKDFTVRLPDGGSAGAVEIPQDDLPGDNRHPFVIDFMSRVNVLVVNGSPRTVVHRDETFFLRAALRPSRDSASRITPTYVKPDELTPAQLAYVDVVILANVSALSEAQVAALKEWVRKGGGLLVTAGENVTQEGYAGKLSGLLPLPLRDVVDSSARPALLTGVLRSHPALQVFNGMPDASLFNARTSRYVLVDTAPRADTKVLMSFTDGAPALLEGHLGEGRTVLWTTTIDRDWTDLPFRTSFLPLMQQLVLYLAGRLDKSENRPLVVGEPRTIVVGRGVTDIEVTRPDGHSSVFSGADLAAREVRYRETSVAGVYRVTQKHAAGRDEERFAVNVDPRESVLAQAEKSQVELTLLAGPRAQTGAIQTTDVPHQRGELWPIMLMSLFVLLGMETWLAFQTA